MEQSVITSPCPAQPKERFPLTWLGGLHCSCTGREAVGQLWYIHAAPSTGIPFSMAVSRTTWQVGFFLLSDSYQFSQGMSPEG